MLEAGLRLGPGVLEVRRTAPGMGPAIQPGLGSSNAAAPRTPGGLPSWTLSRPQSGEILWKGAFQLMEGRPHPGNLPKRDLTDPPNAGRPWSLLVSPGVLSPSGFLSVSIFLLRIPHRSLDSGHTNSPMGAVLQCTSLQTR